MNEDKEVIQTVNESGYVITHQNNPDAYDVAGIIDDMLEEKGGDFINIKMWIMDLITIPKKKEDDFYNFCGFHFNIVDVYGVIVSRKSNSYGDLFRVDDGTGEINCWKFHNQNELELDKLCNLTEPNENYFLDELSFTTTEYSDPKMSSAISERVPKMMRWLREQTVQDIKKTSLDSGATVQIRGELIDFRDKRSIQISNIRQVFNINEEIDRRFELIHLYDTVYSKKI